MAALRRIMPQRSLSYVEALRVAELQAEHLLRLEEALDAPVVNDVITSQPSLEVTEAPGLQGSGRAQWRAGRWHIELNASEPSARRRFTLGHEYKHILDAPFDSLVYRSIVASRGPSAIEQICDYFSACLLMPKRLVKQLWNAGVQTDVELARRFDVSVRAMQIRLQTLGLTKREGPYLSPGDIERDIRRRTYWRQSPAPAFAYAIGGRS